MSGHSKWSTIKRKKAAKDASRGRVFSRLAKEVTVAARIGGGDLEGNPRLRSAVEAARKENMPGQNIDRAIKRGTGELPGMAIEEVTYEGFGPGGVAILVQVATDNRNRTVSTIRKIFEKNGGSLGEANSVAWMFRQVGYFLVHASNTDEEELLSVVLDTGAENLSLQGGMYEVISPPTEFAMVRTALRDHGIEADSEELAMLPNTYVHLDQRETGRCLRLVEALEEDDDVQNVWANLELSDEVVADLAEAG